MKKRVKVIMLPTEDLTAVIKQGTSSTLYSKDSWNREELITTVIDLFLKEREYREKYSHFIDREDLNEWINKNL